ncbi:uncharacterized protein LOC143040912 [Oratosquilla oratoria]|uniref:uncharacterized protein LOC143040912 n=1 Tax=Oratosquilla oratoria TaxID=337810 RepID=UPI003F7732A3
MKTLVVVCVCFAATLVAAQEKAAAPPSEKPTETSSPAPPSSTSETVPPEELKVYTRDLPADVLRDFPGLCFASTQCSVKQVGEDWPLLPFCGRATCVLQGELLIERVEDCGPLPKPNPKCRVINVNDTQKPFPECCPQFECEDGIQLEFPALPGPQTGLPVDATSPVPAEGAPASAVASPPAEGSTPTSAGAA